MRVTRKNWTLAASAALLFGMMTTSSALAADAKDASADSQQVMLGEGDLLQGIPGEGPLKLAEIQKWLAKPENHAVLDVQLPEGLAAGAANIAIPADNPMTRAKIELGRQLYFDPRLSSDSTISCASCHMPTVGYAAATQFGVGVRGQQGGRNSPVAYNRILSNAQFWDGRADSLEDQAVGPIANPIEMANTHDACISTLSDIKGYVVQFEAIFDDGLTIDNVGKAIATFERAVVTGPTPYDAYLPLQQFEKVYADDLAFLDELREEDPEFVKKYESLKEAVAKNPMTESAARGMELFFGKAACATCHSGANFTDEQYHNLGVGMEVEKPDMGRYEVTKKEADRGAFKTPTLRNVAVTGPYMHDGSQKTLLEVMEWYNKGGHKNPWLSDKVKPLNLTEQEVADVVAFMEQGLTGSFPDVEAGRLPE